MTRVQFRVEKENKRIQSDGSEGEMEEERVKVEQRGCR